MFLDIAKAAWDLLISQPRFLRKHETTLWHAGVILFYSQGSRDTTTLVFNKTLLLYFVTITVLVAFLKNMWVWMHLSYWWWLSQSDISVMGSVRSSLPIISSSTLQILCSVLCSMQCRLVSVCIAGAAPQTIAIIFIWYNHFFFLFLGLINIYTHLYRKLKPVLNFSTSVNWSCSWVCR